MRVAIDCSCVERQTTSIGVFQLNLVNSLAKICGSDELHLYATEEGANLLRLTGNTRLEKIRGGNALIRLREIAKALEVSHPDVFLATFNLSPRLPSGTRLVLQVHDFSHGRKDVTLATFVSGTVYRFLMSRSLKRADIVLANSECTAAQGRAKVRANTEIQVIPHDCDPEFKDARGVPEPRESLARMKLVSRRYILCVGRVGPRYKRTRTLLEAFRDLPIHDIKLVVVTNDSFRAADRRFVRENHLDVTEIHGIDRGTLVSLYRSALMMVYPSAYEGFGAPILEAQNSRCPLIVRDLPPMNSIAGDGALLFDGSSRDLLEKMTRIATNPTLASDLISRGSNNAATYDWTLVAKRTKAALEASLRRGTRD